VEEYSEGGRGPQWAVELLLLLLLMMMMMVL
jgi:hypothetical protein